MHCLFLFTIGLL